MSRFLKLGLTMMSFVAVVKGAVIELTLRWAALT
jgi:hypothetical protein